MAVSTICRGCGTHLKIENGKAKAPYQTRFSGFPSIGKPDLDDKNKPSQLGITVKPEEGHSFPTQAPAERHDASENLSNPVVKPEDFTQVRAHDTHVGPPRMSGTPVAPTTFGDKIFATLGAVNKAVRDISCFECGHRHQVSSLSTSSQCPKCGLYISLKDYDIREAWSQRIQTRGDVTVHKKGIVQSATIRCHNLIIDGVFNGGADCSGDFTIRNHGKIMGRVSCRKLLVEKRAHVQFLNNIEAEEVIIDGEVIGNINCRGKLSLLKKATLTGDIHVGSLTVAEGAKHTGQISMGW